MIVAAGEALVDLFPADAGGSTWTARPGGSPLNVAVTVARLGGPAGFLGRLSTDRFGALLLAHLRASGVSERFVSSGPEPTALAVVEPGSADREPGFAFHGEGSADRSLRPADARLDDTVRVVHFAGSLTLVREPAATVLEAVMERAAGRCLVTLDPNVRPTVAGDAASYRERLARWLARADVVKVSAADLGWLAPGEDPEAVAGRWLAAEPGPVAVVVTRGAAGSVVMTAEHRVEVPAAPVTVVDTVGAGDSFMGGFLVALDRREAVDRAAVSRLAAAVWAECLAFAARVAALTSTRAGADPPTAAEVEAFTSA